jgi:hypothetical protein
MDIRTRELQSTKGLPMMVSHEPSWRERLSQKAVDLKSRASTSVRTARTDAEGELRSNPGKWAGIAAGAGLGLGLLGRLLHHQLHRKHARRQRMPAVLIVEASC